LLALAATTVALGPKPVRADEQGSFKGTLTVQFTAATTHAQCSSGDGTCNTCIQNSGFYIEAQGLADTSLGPLFAKVLKCSYPPSPSFQFGNYVGTMTLSPTPPPSVGSPKDYLTLIYSGQNNDAGDFYGFQPFGGKLTVTRGFGKLQGAKGAIMFIAQSGLAFATSGAANISYSGNAFYSLQGTINQGE
jgi:hypothetical protein